MNRTEYLWSVAPGVVGGWLGAVAGMVEGDSSNTAHTNALTTIHDQQIYLNGMLRASNGIETPLVRQEQQHISHLKAEVPVNNAPAYELIGGSAGFVAVVAAASVFTFIKRRRESRLTRPVFSS